MRIHEVTGSREHSSHSHRGTRGTRRPPARLPTRPPLTEGCVDEQRRRQALLLSDPSARGPQHHGIDLENPRGDGRPRDGGILRQRQQGGATGEVRAQSVVSFTKSTSSAVK